MKHYWTENADLENLKSIDYYFGKDRYSLYTSDGVFSKNSVDFGSSLLLKTFVEDVDFADMAVLDVGCGYGAMSIVIGNRIKSAHIHMVDISDRAIALVEMNIKEHALQDRLHAFKSDKYSEVSSVYDYIITNPPIRTGKANVHEIILGGINYLKESGSIYVVIQKKQGAKSAIKAMEEVYTKVDVIKRDKGYFIIKGQK